MKRIAVMASTLAWLVSPLNIGHALAGGLGGNGGGCGGLGSLGPSIGAGIGCAGAPPAPPPPQQSHPAKSVGGSTGYTWEPAHNIWGLVSCPSSSGPNMPSALQLYGPSGQPIGNPVVVCPQQGKPAPNAPPPPPPTSAVVWTAIPLPAPAFDVDPARVGITQLPSWFWVTGAGQAVTVNVNINGYSVTTTATPVAYQWDFGDGADATSYSAGNAASPSITHTYHYKGTYVVTVSIVYGGTFSYAGPGGSGTAGLGQYEQPGVFKPYVVQEVRSVLVPAGER